MIISASLVFITFNAELLQIDLVYLETKMSQKA